MRKSVQDRHLRMDVDLDVGRDTHRAQVRPPGVSQGELFRQSERGNDAALFTSIGQGADDNHPKQTKRIVKKHGSFLLSMILGQS